MFFLHRLIVVIQTLFSSPFSSRTCWPLTSVSTRRFRWHLHTEVGHWKRSRRMHSIVLWHYAVSHASLFTRSRVAFFFHLVVRSQQCWLVYPHDVRFLCCSEKSKLRS